VAAPLLSEVRFASLLAYSPRGQTEMDRKSRGVRDQVKQDKDGIIALAAQRIQERWGSLGIEDFLGPDALLVPAPRSAPLIDERALWPGRRICEELVGRGLAADLSPCLERHTAVPKAAFAAPGQRTRAQRHVETLHVSTPLIHRPHRVITIVDDFVTTGAMLIACASLVSAAFRSSTIACFGLVRRLESVSELLAPCSGCITLDEATGDTWREP
jgi:hypothetical protein